MDVITFPENRYTTSGLQILLHGVISLPDATSYDNAKYNISIYCIAAILKNGLHFKIVRWLTYFYQKASPEEHLAPKALE